jgi:chromosome segregation ATPase
MIDKQRSEITKLGLAKLALQTSAQKATDEESRYADQFNELQKKYSELADSKNSLDAENQSLSKKWVDQGEALTDTQGQLEKLKARLKKAEQNFSDVDEENVKLKEKYEDIIEENLVSKRKVENLESKISNELASKDQESQNIIDKLNSEFEREKSQQQQDRVQISHLQIANKRLIEKNRELEQILSDLESNQKTTQESLLKLAPAHADLNSQVTKYEKMMVILETEKETIQQQEKTLNEENSDLRNKNLTLNKKCLTLEHQNNDQRDLIDHLQRNSSALSQRLNHAKHHSAEIYTESVVTIKRTVTKTLTLESGQKSSKNLQQKSYLALPGLETQNSDKEVVDIHDYYIPCIAKVLTLKSSRNLSNKDSHVENKA